MKSPFQALLNITVMKSTGQVLNEVWAHDFLTRDTKFLQNVFA